MKGKVPVVFFLLMSLLMVLPGCGRKGPPTLPRKSSSLIKIEHKTQLPGCCRPATWSNGGTLEDFDVLIVCMAPTLHRSTRVLNTMDSVNATNTRKYNKPYYIRRSN
jgi:predicted small lipoprotein YifL